MKVYRITEDANKYQWVMPEDNGHLLSDLIFECHSKEREWSPIKMFVFNPQKKKGNFYTMGGLGALVFDEKVLDIMLTIFEMAGEILPFEFEETKLYVLNVLQCTNSIDSNKSTWNFYPDGTKGRLLKYSFHKERLTDSSIFKIPETCKSEVLTYSGIGDAEEEFIYLYHKHRLSGLIFEEVFSE
jgi:hypothetical protein